MIIGRDPFKFSVIIDKVDEWSDNSIQNGVMLITVDGFMFPDKELLNITFGYLGWGFLDKLKAIPEDRELYAIKDKKTAFGEICGRVYPDDPDLDGDQRFNITPEEICDRRYTIFAVKCGENVRILAARPVYDKENSRYITEKAVVRETYVTTEYINEMIRQTEIFLKIK